MSASDDDDVDDAMDEELLERMRNSRTGSSLAAMINSAQRGVTGASNLSKPTRATIERAGASGISATSAVSNATGVASDSPSALAGQMYSQTLTSVLNNPRENTIWWWDIASGYWEEKFEPKPVLPRPGFPQIRIEDFRSELILLTTQVRLLSPHTQVTLMRLEKK